MPTTLHEGLVSLFRDDPELIVALVEHRYGLRLTSRADLLIDRHAEFAVDARHYLHVNPRSIDLVLVIEDPEHPDGGVAIIVEVQLDHDPDKRRRIACYLGLVVDRHDLPVHVGVVALKDGVARNLARWKVGSALTVETFVIDRRCVPKMKCLAEARRWPTMAILSGAVHGFHGDLEAARIGLTVALEQERSCRARYAATVLAALSDERRAIFLGALPKMQRQQLSQLERESGTYLFGVREGRKEGRQQRRRADLIEFVFAVLELRGLAIDDEQARAIRAAQLDELERWWTRVREVEGADELFEP